MEDWAFPRQFGHHPRVRSPEPNMNLVFVADQHVGFWIGLPEAAAEEPQHVKIGRRAVGLKAKNRAIGGEPLERLKITLQPSSTGRFTHRIVLLFIAAKFIPPQFQDTR